MSFWRDVDGMRDASTDPRISTSEIVQAFMPGSRVVKTFHHMGTTTSRAKPARPGQLAARWSSSPVPTLVNAFGFDPAVAGLLTERIRLESGAEPLRRQRQRRRATGQARPLPGVGAWPDCQ
jgi:predicted dinucleotide-binding enzyme